MNCTSMVKGHIVKTLLPPIFIVRLNASKKVRISANASVVVLNTRFEYSRRVARCPNFSITHAGQTTTSCQNRESDRYFVFLMSFL